MDANNTYIYNYILVTVVLAVIMASLVHVDVLAQEQLNVYPEALEGNVIKIGATISLSGKYSVEGSTSLCGLKAAIDWINDNGGINVNGINYKLQLVYRDDGSNPSNTRRQYQSLVESGIKLFIAPFGSDLIEAAEAGVRGYPVVMYSYMPVPDNVLEATMGDIIVNVASSLDSRARLVLEMVTDIDPAARIGVFYVNNPYGLNYLSHLTEFASEMSLRVVYQRDYTDVSEVKDAIYSLKSNNPEVLVVVAQSLREASVIVKTIYDGGVNLKLLVIDGAASLPVFYTNLSAVVAENVASVSEWEPGKGIYNPQAASSKGLPWYGPVEDEIIEYYKKHCIIQPNWISMGASASILLLAKALEDAGSMKFVDIKNAISSMSLMTFYGVFDVDESGKQVGHKPILVQWREGEKRVVYPDRLSEAPVNYPAPNWWKEATTLQGRSETTTPRGVGGFNLGVPVVAAILAIIVAVILIVARRR